MTKKKLHSSISCAGSTICPFLYLCVNYRFLNEFENNTTSSKLKIPGECIGVVIYFQAGVRFFNLFMDVGGRNRLFVGVSCSCTTGTIKL